jgi:hypothetical protein
MPPWITGQMAESRMADRQMEAGARRHVGPPEPPAARPTSGEGLPSRSRLARWAGRTLIAGGEWLAGRDGGVTPERRFG